jgi:hypothetical protein
MKQTLSIFLVGLVLMVLGGLITMSFSKEFGNKSETVSIHKYNTLKKRVEYLYDVNKAKDVIIYDLMVNKQLDSTFILSISNHIPLFIMDSKNVDYDKLCNKDSLVFQLDSICVAWYESIPFMFMDDKHDSAWVLNSESYQISKEIVNSIKNKKGEI